MGLRRQHEIRRGQYKEKKGLKKLISIRGIRRRIDPKDYL
jgi:hypothetical protein